jgi:hypothetical protein
LPHSLPALASFIAQPEKSWPCNSVVIKCLNRPFVPAYRAPEQADKPIIARHIAEGVAILAERLRRLPRAYPHWHRFDPAAYFDLHPRQVAAMVRIEALGATLDVTIYADLLSPAFRRAERFWAREFCPAYFAAGQKDVFDAHFWQRILPAMQRRLQEAREEISLAGDVLFRRGDVTFLSVSAASDERASHQHRIPDDEALLILYQDIPTLTLRRSYDILEMMSEEVKQGHVRRSRS